MHCGYFKYCEKLTKEEILHQRQLPYPCCPCGAGVCRLETEKTQGPNYGRKYFACRIQKVRPLFNNFCILTVLILKFVKVVVSLIMLCVCVLDHIFIRIIDVDVEC